MAAFRPTDLSRRAVLGACAALAACGRAEAPVDEEGRVRLRFATDTPAQAGHGGFYQALASGAYAKRGLNVQIVQGGPDMDVPQRLAAGAVELGLASSSFQPLDLVASGAPVKAVAAFLQKDPSVLVTRRAEGLTSIGALKGRDFLIPEAQAGSVWAWLKAKYGFTDAERATAAADVAALLERPRAVLLGSVTTTPQAVAAAEGGFEPQVFVLADDAYASYGGLVLAPTAFARDNAQALRAFIAASAEGWRDYVQGDGRAAHALIRRDNPALTLAMLEEARQRLKTGGFVDGGDAALYGLGAMTAERWQAFFLTASQAGVYPAGLAWSEAYTTQYLPGRG